MKPSNQPPIASEESLNKGNPEQLIMDDSILNCIQDGIGIVDTEEKIIYCNQAFAEIFDTPAADLKGRNLLDFFDRETAEKILEQTERRRKGQSSSYDLPISSRHGTEWLHVSISPRMNKKGHYTGAVGIVQNVTEQKKADDRQKRHADELKHSNEQLEQFAYVASHDLQEPLRMITSYLQLLQKRYHGKLGDDANDFIGYAVNSAERMSNMIHALLKYSRIGTRGKDPSPVDANQVLKNVLLHLHLMIEERQAEITSDPLPVVNADENQLHQLFQNLIMNAIKFHGETAPRIHITARQQSEFWEFEIQDHGIGIAEEDTERIFNIFQRVEQNRNTPGAGIGLAICKRIVERHGGSIRVQSRPQAGSVFLFTLPNSTIRDEKYDHQIIDTQH